MIVQSSGDTIVAITTSQMESLLRVKVDLMECRDIQDTTATQIGRYKLAIMERDSIRAIMQMQLSLQETRVNDCNSILKDIQVTLTKAAKKIKRQDRLLRVLGIVAVIETAALAVFIFK